MNNTELFISIIGAVIALLLSLVAWIGNNMVNKLEKISGSLSRIEKELGVLGNDHDNLKDEVRKEFLEVKERLRNLETV